MEDLEGNGRGTLIWDKEGIGGGWMRSLYRGEKGRGRDQEGSRRRLDETSVQG